MSKLDNQPPTESDGWADILLPDEAVEWQGRPTPGIHLSGQDFLQIPFGLFFAGFALFWISAASHAGGYFWMFGLLHFSVGLFIVLQPLLVAPMLRRKTVYTLTNRRAFIANEAPVTGRSLESWHLERMESLQFTDRNPGSVYFAERQSWRGLRHRTGFQRIAEARKVYSMMSALRDDLLRQGQADGAAKVVNG